MIKKLISPTIILSLFIANQIIADCGGDHTDSKSVGQGKKVRVNTLVTSLPDDGNIEGLVITSCGQCKFGYKKKRGCSLTIKIGETIYPVKGTSIHDHGNEHSSDGFCNAVRVAWATGQITKDVFHAESFVLVGDSK